MTPNAISDPCNAESMEGFLTISRKGIEEIGRALRSPLASFSTAYVKTKRFHRHMQKERFRDYDLLLAEQEKHLGEAKILPPKGTARHPERTAD
jgi:hypothetical protein